MISQYLEKAPTMAFDLLLVKSAYYTRHFNLNQLEKFT